MGISGVSEGEPEIKAYVRWLLARTHSLLDRPAVWQAVEALALALLEYESLTRGRVKALSLFDGLASERDRYPGTIRKVEERYEMVVEWVDPSN